MNSASRILLLALALGGPAAADLPRKAPLTKYAGLWTNSPFTSKPPPAEAGPVANPLEDYALAGVSPVGNGYRVTLLNKKTPTERITVDSDNPKSDFKILAVTRKSGDPLGTVVRMSSGSLVGSVSFDEKLLTLVAAPVAAKVNPNAPKAVPIPGQPPQPVTTGPQRQPRPRVVPPATSGTGSTGSTGAAGTSTPPGGTSTQPGTSSTGTSNTHGHNSPIRRGGH
jgi:hypothetical protein